MENNSLASGLGEAFGSYQPTSMPAETWARFREDVFRLLGRLPFERAEQLRPHLARLAVFLGDVASRYPDKTLAELLDGPYVKGHLQRRIAAGDADGTVQNRQGSLNRFLRAESGQMSAGTTRSPSRSAESHLKPYAMEQLTRTLERAAADGGSAAVALARTVCCGLAGAQVPTRTRPASVDVQVDGRVVTVGEARWVAPPGVTLPASGQLSEKDVAAGREWAKQRCALFLDVRRLHLTWITAVVAAEPAVVALQLPGVGRDRLSAAVEAAPRPVTDEVRRMLRGV